MLIRRSNSAQVEGSGEAGFRAKLPPRNGTIWRPNQARALPLTFAWGPRRMGLCRYLCPNI